MLTGRVVFGPFHPASLRKKTCKEGTGAVGRPQKYQTEADRQAARRLSDAARKRRKRAVDSAAKNALKKDPTKRKDAAVNAEAYPFAPISDETMAAINSVVKASGAVDFSGSPKDLRQARMAVAVMLEWEEANKLKLPDLEPKIYHGTLEERWGNKPFSYPYGEEHQWNQLRSTLHILAHFMELWGRNKTKANRHAERERAEADAAGVTVAKLRDRKDAVAKQKWEDKTQTAFHRAKSDEALAKQTARIERESTERMERQETFGRF
ncbi:hypothetical protein RU07_21820 [Agrobacterium tumefaciens]|uniref:Uncharacterized protein n=1 Tax=Agrobacterium tumefaciens TaxID=358 RepID=A0A0D0KIV8_AGRTU|nr:hypothetical protein RU07_21820 [Agrobacterium tumefaciens]